MKKNFILIISLCFCILLVGSVAAMWPFENVGITGNPVVQYEKEQGVLENYPKCYGTGTYLDSEGGPDSKDLFNKGSLTINNNCKKWKCELNDDWCNDNQEIPAVVLWDECQGTEAVKEYYTKQDRDAGIDWKKPKYEIIDCPGDSTCHNGKCIDAELRCSKDGEKVTAFDGTGTKIEYMHGNNDHFREPIDGCLDPNPNNLERVDDPNDLFDHGIHIASNPNGDQFTASKEIVFDCDPITKEVTMVENNCPPGTFCEDGKCPEDLRKCQPLSDGTGIMLTDVHGEETQKINTCSNADGTNEAATGTYTKEFACDADGMLEGTPAIPICASGCVDGTCPGVVCLDTDDQNDQANLNQRNYLVERLYQIHNKGTTSVGGAIKVHTYVDHCVGETRVLEYWCSKKTSSSMNARSFNCPEGEKCSYGKCDGTVPTDTTNVVPEPIAKCTGTASKCSASGIYFACENGKYANKGEVPGKCGVAGGVVECTEGDTRCSGEVYSICSVDGEFVEQATTPAGMCGVPGEECSTGDTKCSGADYYTCDAAGQFISAGSQEGECGVPESSLLLELNFDSETNMDQTVEKSKNVNPSGGLYIAGSCKKKGNYGLSVFGSNRATVDNRQDISLTEEITVSSWVSLSNPSASRNSYGFQNIAGKWNNNERQGYRLAIYNNQLYFGVYPEGRSYYQAVKDISSWGVSEMHHVVGTYNYVTGHIELYIDGVSARSMNLGNYKLKTTTNPLYVGNKGGASHFYGCIDEVQIHDRALLDDEVKTLFESYN